MKFPRLLIIAAPLCAASFTSAATVLLDNGDFSSGTNPVATGWTRVDGAGTNSSPSNYAEAVPGSTWGRSMQLKSDGGNHVQQTLSLTNEGAMDASTFGNFTVSFDYGYRRDGARNGDHTIRVSLWNLTDDVELAGQDLLILDPGSTGANSLSPASFNLLYDNSLVALAGADIGVRFTSQSADLGANAWQRTAMIDNVTITAIPEPSFALLGGLGLLGLLRRRR